MDGPRKPAAPKLYLRTFGCQMNEYDSARMADTLQAADGYRWTVKSGAITFVDGQWTGATPGHVVRGAQPDPEARS